MNSGPLGVRFRGDAQRNRIPPQAGICEQLFHFGLLGFPPKLYLGLKSLQDKGLCDCSIVFQAGSGPSSCLLLGSRY